MLIPRLLLFTSLILGNIVPSPGLGAQVQSARHDQSSPRSIISGRHVLAASLLLAATLMGDQGLRGEFQEHRGNTSNSIAGLGNAIGDPRYLLPAIGAGYVVGQVTGDEDLTRMTLHAGRAAVLAGGIVTALKFVVGRSRPTQSEDADVFRPFSGWNSFPSGHTTLAFAVATAIADETEDQWSDIAVYGVATATAFARLNDDRHWTSDVLVGALVGHLSARWLSRRHGLHAGPGAVGITLEF